MIKQQSNDKASNYNAQNLHKLSSCVFFADNFREFKTLDVVYKEIFKLHVLLN